MKTNWSHIGVHIVFWVLYIVIWGIHDLAFAPTFWDTLDGNIIGSAWYAIGVYINLFLLIPYLLLKNKRWTYLLSIVLLTLAVSYGLAQTFAWHYASIDLGTSNFFNSAQGIANTASDFLVVYGLATCLYFINEWYIKERKLRALESQNLKAELDLLKGQMNPHFLFNALNSVHVLIRTNPDLAAETLEKFSDLLSHQLYDVSKDKISLSDEIQNLDNFIQLQKMRYEDHVVVDWECKGVLEGKRISPMMFLNFVENAFKHGETSGTGPVNVNILVRVEDNSLEFSCVNTRADAKDKSGNKGLGIENIKRRLNLVYPNKHRLEIEEHDDTYSVHLGLNLNED